MGELVSTEALAEGGGPEEGGIRMGVGRSERGRSALLLAGLASVAGMSLAGVSSVSASVPAKKAASSALTVHESLVLLDGGMTGHSGWPEIVGSANIDLPANATVVLTIYSFDTGSAPLAKGLPYDKVSGTVGGTETVDGKTVTSVANADLAHTFTVPGLDLNLAIPVATSSKGGEITPAVVTASFHLAKKGSFTWQCYAPCGSGKGGMGGPMATPGYMTGKVNVA